LKGKGGAVFFLGKKSNGFARRYAKEVPEARSGRFFHHRDERRGRRSGEPLKGRGGNARGERGRKGIESRPKWLAAGEGGKKGNYRLFEKEWRSWKKRGGFTALPEESRPPL